MEVPRYPKLVALILPHPTRSDRMRQRSRWPHVAPVAVYKFNVHAALGSRSHALFNPFQLQDLGKFQEAISPDKRRYSYPNLLGIVGMQSNSEVSHVVKC